VTGVQTCALPISIRGAVRVIGASEAIPALRGQIMNQSWIYILVTTLIPFLYLYNFAASLAGRRVRWRGIQYEIVSADQTRILTTR